MHIKGVQCPFDLSSHRMIPITYFPEKKQVMYHSSQSYHSPRPHHFDALKPQDNRGLSGLRAILEAKLLFIAAFENVIAFVYRFSINALLILT
jgi:hypothetical protein